MTDEIPSDIMRAAHLLLNEIAMCAPEDFAGRRALVESAILAERQRCAKVASDYGRAASSQHLDSAAYMLGSVAQAILKGKHT
jgi:hypothetical protein